MTSIRTQLTRRLLLVLAGLLGLGLIVIYVTVRHALIGSFDTALRARALAVSALTEIEDGKIQFDFSADFLVGFGASHPRNYFELWDAAGKALKRSPSLGEADLPFRVDGSPAAPVVWDFPLTNGRSARGVTFRFNPSPDENKPDEKMGPPVQLALAVDRHELDESLWGLLVAVTGAGGFLLLAVFLIVPMVLRRNLAPLNLLAEQAARIDAGSLATRFPSGELPAELQVIADRLNDLLARLELSFERERRFSADLAHELRTPLAELRSVVECALKWPGARAPETDQDLLAIATQMETLVTRMLTLARGEGGQLAAKIEQVAIDTLTRQAWLPLAERAATRQLQSSFSVSAGIVSADRVLLQAILGNLLGNAVEYTAAGSELVVTGRKATAGYVIVVTNPAPELEPSDLPRLFDRFWRKESARSGGEHFGLGLSLARVFAQAMGWRLSAELNAQHWIVFTLTNEPAAESARA